ncbi:MAG TPA: acetate--CoA ligase family protein [Solirubrobacteraceae bacterium]|nr:acetate--CoA ligase family protein [Solirubrobacteraceae bacterium]
MSGSDLQRLFAPRSIAVVGANDRPGSYASQALINLDAIGYRGEVWGVNPNRTEALGRPCVPTVDDLPEPADAVIVAIPAPAVPAVIAQAGARGCGGAVVFSAGFAEVSTGADLQRELVQAAERHAFPVCGPNCNGIVSMPGRFVLWGDAFTPREPGSVALVSQSGNVAVNALATRRGLRFHTVVASGNQAVVSAADYLEHLATQDGVRAIALYLEDDGGARLCDGLAACAENDIAVVVLKVGSSPAGARAAAAHSAALAGDQRVFRSLVTEAGAVWAQDVHELLELAKTLAVPRAPARGRGLAIMTCSGGDSAQGADEAVHCGLELPELTPATCERLRELLPSAATVANPLDYTAMIWGERSALSELVQTVGEDPAVDQLLVFYDEPAGLQGAVEESWRAVRDGIIDGAARSPVSTLVSSTLPELLDDESAWRFIEAGVPAAAGLRTGMACAAAAMSPRAGDPARLRAIGATAAHSAGLPAGPLEWLPEHEAKRLLAAAGLSVVEGRVVADEDEACAALEEFGGHVALKLCAASIQHKSELGAVELGLTTAELVRAAYRRLRGVTDGEVLVERMAQPGVELLIAARTDGIVPALVLGLGGLWTELLDDVAVVPLPAGAARIERALRGLRAAAVLDGGRGRPRVDVVGVAGLAARLGEVLIEQGLALIECNPVLVGPTGAVAVDAAILAPARVASCTT